MGVSIYEPGQQDCLAEVGIISGRSIDARADISDATITLDDRSVFNWRLGDRQHPTRVIAHYRVGIGLRSGAGAVSVGVRGTESRRGGRRRVVSNTVGRRTLSRRVVSNTVGVRLRVGTGSYPGCSGGGVTLTGFLLPPEGTGGFNGNGPVSICGTPNCCEYGPCLSQSRVGSVPEM